MTLKVDDSQFDRIAKLNRLLTAIKEVAEAETAFLKRQLVIDREADEELFHTFYLVALKEHIELCDFDIFMYNRKLRRLTEG